MTEKNAGAPAGADQEEPGLKVPRTAMKDPEHLKRWLAATDRHFTILRNSDLVDCLPWPHGPEILQKLLAAYNDARRVQTVETGPCPLMKKHDRGICRVCQGTGVVAVRVKSELLEPDEIELLQKQLAAQKPR